MVSSHRPPRPRQQRPERSGRSDQAKAARSHRASLLFWSGDVRGQVTPGTAAARRTTPQELSDRMCRRLEGEFAARSRQPIAHKLRPSRGRASQVGGPGDQHQWPGWFGHSNERWGSKRVGIRAVNFAIK